MFWVESVNLAQGYFPTRTIFAGMVSASEILCWEKHYMEKTLTSLENSTLFVFGPNASSSVQNSLTRAELL